jgi:hypothetical protein
MLMIITLQEKCPPFGLSAVHEAAEERAPDDKYSDGKSGELNDTLDPSPPPSGDRGPPAERRRPPSGQSDSQRWKSRVQIGRRGKRGEKGRQDLLPIEARDGEEIEKGECERDGVRITKWHQRLGEEKKEGGVAHVSLMLIRQWNAEPKTRRQRGTNAL